MNSNLDGAQPIAPEQGGDAADELAYRLRQQQLTARFGLFALKTHDIDALLQEATRTCAEGLHSEFCKIMEFLPAENEFVVRAGVGWKPGVVGAARTGADLESPAGFALKTAQPVISNHLAEETRFRTPRLLVDHGVKRAINVIIQGDGGPFGVLEVDSPIGGRFTEHDLAFMQGFANLLGVAIERQQAEEELRANKTLLQQALEDQDVLTREISHRVKNSLQLVAGLLNMQGRASGNDDLRRALADAEARVHTIAQVHDRLWRHNEMRSVNLAEFLGELCVKLRATSSNVTLGCSVDPVIVPTDLAVPLGLLVNELVTNAFKYAYPEGTGEVRVELTSDSPERLRLEVSDQGIGLPSDFNPARSRSLGMRLVASLTRQLEGQLEWQDAQPGTRFVLEVSAQDGPQVHL
ncbi:sensor histidine kinase [Microvirga tunisiensis]|uniref:histidine kinase n=1 Tax=Microvirga tunisiensis TaxID=2108360 RepID=A0A5N7MU07_9HYPH|nr:histidine kinase dimerization/phosphoacceptor domain -containing protein [Microvirga tunisiensis]MPR12215.1 GAF domain-containing protein [Microvirga tunisiensis]MPR30150.1 GAF domain-containing protein [Microvirga tunisiensis]